MGGNLLGMALNASGLHLPPPPGTSFDMMFKVLHVPSLMVGSSILVVVSLALASILPAMPSSSELSSLARTATVLRTDRE